MQQRCRAETGLSGWSGSTGHGLTVSALQARNLLSWKCGQQPRPPTSDLSEHDKRSLEASRRNRLADIVLRACAPLLKLVISHKVSRPRLLGCFRITVPCTHAVWAQPMLPACSGRFPSTRPWTRASTQTTSTSSQRPWTSPLCVLVWTQTTTGIPRWVMV